MGKNSKIEWTHHTFNPWWGCTKVSPACNNCYAESWATRVGLSLWGKNTPRRFFSEDHWAEPIEWNREAEAEGQRRRVFCASMGDVFEDRKDLQPWRERLWLLVAKTPHLDWLLLTKRVEHVGHLNPWGKKWPRNVWLGTSVEQQVWAQKRLPGLVKYPAAVLFVSCEPLLGALDLKPWLQPNAQSPNAIGWVITGGESGPRARPTNPIWIEDLRDQCANAEVPFNFKQWGHWCPVSDREAVSARTVEVPGRDGRTITLAKLGKKAAGRKLAGRVWDAVPQPSLLIR